MEKYEIELIEEYSNLNLYSIKIAGNEYSEFENFVIRFSDNPLYKEDMDIILSWLDVIAQKGALERYFRPESSFKSKVVAIPIETNKLRLYCIRLTDGVLILGNGEVKDSDSWQNSATLSPLVRLLEDTERFILSRIKNGSLVVDNKKLIGNLKFRRKKQ